VCTHAEVVFVGFRESNFLESRLHEPAPDINRKVGRSTMPRPDDRRSRGTQRGQGIDRPLDVGISHVPEDTTNQDQVSGNGASIGIGRRSIGAHDFDSASGARSSSRRETWIEFDQSCRDVRGARMVRQDSQQVASVACAHADRSDESWRLRVEGIADESSNHAETRCKSGPGNVVLAVPCSPISRHADMLTQQGFEGTLHSAYLRAVQQELAADHGQLDILEFGSVLAPALLRHGRCRSAPSVAAEARSVGRHRSSDVATLYLMVGLPCSGKTTLARVLEHQHSALRLTPDEWHIRLFGQDAEDPEHDARHRLVETLQWEVARRALALGTDVILDFGFWAREEREDYRSRARELGANSEVRFLDVPESELLRRLAQRNAQPSTPAFHIPDWMMRPWIASFQKPTPEELRRRE